MIHSRKPAVGLALLSALALLLTLTMSPASAGGNRSDRGSDRDHRHHGNGRHCPVSADSTEERWACALLVLNGVDRRDLNREALNHWAQVAANEGHLAAAEGIVFSDSSIDATLGRLYHKHLDRRPEASALTYWRDQVRAQRSELAAEVGILGSAEYFTSQRSTDHFVGSLYRYFLDRGPSQAERAYWASQIDVGAMSPSTVASAIATSPEAGVVRALHLYKTYAHRSPDATGIAHWGQQAREGMLSVVAPFAATPEVVNKLGASHRR